MYTLFNTTVFSARTLPLRGMELTQPDNSPHRHEFTELVLITGGTARHEAEGGGGRIERGTILLIPPGAAHVYRNCEKLALINILFDAAHLPLPLLDLTELPGAAMLAAPPGCRQWQLRGDAFAAVENPARELAAEDVAKRPGSQAARFGLFLALLIRLARTMPAAAKPPAPTGIGEAVARLRRTFAAEFAPELLAARAGMSRSGFFAAFRKHTGFSPYAYCAQLRVEKACELLRSTDWAVSRIAEAVGFADSNAFSRTFRRLEGKSPREFRRGGLEKPAMKQYSTESREKTE